MSSVYKGLQRLNYCKNLRGAKYGGDVKAFLLLSKKIYLLSFVVVCCRIIAVRVQGVRNIRGGVQQKTNGAGTSAKYGTGTGAKVQPKKPKNREGVLEKQPPPPF